MQGLIIGFQPIVGDLLGIECQNFRCQKFNRDPGQNEKAGIIGNKMQVFFFGGFVPTNEGFPGFDRPGGGTPANTSNRTITDKSDIF